MEQEVLKILQSFGNTYKIPTPFWTEISLEEKEAEVDATVYVSIRLLPNPMFLTNITFASMLQKLVSNPSGTFEDGRSLNLYFAIERNGSEKQATFRKYGDNPGEIPIEFYTDMYEQGMKKLGTFVDQMPVDAAIAYWTVRGLGAAVNYALKEAVPKREELPGGLVLHTSLRRRKL